MAAGDVTFKVLYSGSADKLTVDAATASGADSATTDNNKTIVSFSLANNHIMIVQVLIAT
jgi:hypothetical protein